MSDTFKALKNAMQVKQGTLQLMPELQCDDVRKCGEQEEEQLISLYSNSTRNGGIHCTSNANVTS